MAVAIILSASRRRHVQPDQLGQPVDDRGQHRPAVPRLHRPRGERAHRVRPGPVRDHAAGQRRWRAGSSTVGASSRGRTDDASTRRRPRRAAEAVPPPSSPSGASCRAGRPGRSSSARSSSSAGCWPPPGSASGCGWSASAVVYAVATYAISRGVEGRRKATDRLVTIVVTVGVPAGADPAGLGDRRRGRERPGPLRRGVLHPVDARRRRRGRRGLPRHHGHVDHHGAGRGDVDPDRPAHRDLPGGVRPGQAVAGDHVLRRRHDRHPVDRRGPLRVRAVRAVPRAVRAAWASWARWRCRC